MNVGFRNNEENSSEMIFFFQDQPVRSGYDAKNLASIDMKFICLICRLIFSDPVQLDCGHRICKLHLPQEDT
jgi:hypothetical protein